VPNTVLAAEGETIEIKFDSHQTLIISGTELEPHTEPIIVDTVEGKQLSGHVPYYFIAKSRLKPHLDALSFLPYCLISNDLPQPDQRSLLVPIIHLQLLLAIIIHDGSNRGVSDSAIVEFDSDFVTDFEASPVLRFILFLWHRCLQTVCR
jgi:hypothetical protein